MKEIAEKYGIPENELNEIIRQVRSETVFYPYLDRNKKLMHSLMEEFQHVEHILKKQNFDSVSVKSINETFRFNSRIFIHCFNDFLKDFYNKKKFFDESVNDHDKQGRPEGSISWKTECLKSIAQRLNKLKYGDNQQQRNLFIYAIFHLADVPGFFVENDENYDQDKARSRITQLLK